MSYTKIKNSLRLETQSTAPSSPRENDIYNDASEGLRVYQNGAWLPLVTPINMSSLLAAGTRVTAIPTALGEYRTLIKDPNSRVHNDDAPSVSPTAADGMRIHARSFTQAGVSGEPNQWVIYIGINRRYEIRWFASAGKTGLVYADFQAAAGTSVDDLGVQYAYNPTTGILIVDAGTHTNPNTGSAYIGWAPDGAGSDPSVLNAAYFDVLVY